MCVGTRDWRARAAAGLILLALAAGAWGCAASRAFQRGNSAAMQLDWDLAVTHYDRAAKLDKDNKSAAAKLALARDLLAPRPATATAVPAKP